MQARRGPRRLFALYGFLRHKLRPASTTTLLTLDAVRTSLEVVKESSDVFPPLKSALGAVIALCALADRISASDANAEALAWRAVTILDTIYNSVNPTDPGNVPPQLLHNIEQFERLLTTIYTAMDSIARIGRIRRVLNLRQTESELAKFAARLDSAAETFAIGTMTLQSVSLARIQDAVETVTVISSGLEQSNAQLCGQILVLQVQLRRQIRVLQLTAVFLA
ncbi:hypothetical protein DFH09DRAFT_394036 [Mycena vulgaris]|nr:hypothetical protein DFH09DRAFT_394036 [Mycena vulgaris]